MPGRNNARLDKLFGGQPGAADRALAGMKRSYGRTDGEHVFKAAVAKRKRKQQQPPRPRGKR